MTERSSFSRAVFGRAVADTWQFFEYKPRDFILFLVTLLLGAACAYVFIGKLETKNELVLSGAFTLAPSAIVIAAVFLWHLWLAPAAVAYDAAMAALAEVAASKIAPPPEPVNWAIWKKRSYYTVAEFSAILANQDPVGNFAPSSDRTALVQLMLEWLRRITPRGAINEIGSPSLQSAIAREDAIKWADEIGFSVDHIK